MNTKAPDRGGLIAFDVGVGKTFVAIAFIAAARQRGLTRRPVILVPPGMEWKYEPEETQP
jgi:superfamily II DNA or RNA helicase